MTDKKKSKTKVHSSYRVPHRLKGCWNCKHCHDATWVDSRGRFCVRYLEEGEHYHQERLKVEFYGFGMCDKHEKGKNQ